MMQIQIISSQEAVFDFVEKAINNAISKVPATPGGTIEIEIVDTKKLATRLDVSELTITRWKNKGKIPYLRVGSSIRFNYGNVLQALEVTDKVRGERSR